MGQIDMRHERLPEISRSIGFAHKVHRRHAEPVQTPRVARDPGHLQRAGARIALGQPCGFGTDGSQRIEGRGTRKRQATKLRIVREIDVLAEDER